MQCSQARTIGREMRVYNFSRAAICGALLFSMLIVPNADAQPAPSRGRGNDGRAYRIENGMRLSDYIAELEVANDDLQRQLDAAEDELADKNSHSPKGAARSGSLKEHDLIPNAGVNPNPNGALPPAAQPVQPAQAAQPAVNNQLAAMQAQCDTKVQTLNSKIALLDQQLQQSETAGKCDYNSGANPLAAKVKELEATLASSPTQALLQAEKDKASAKEKELATIKGELITEQEQSDAQLARIAALEQQLKSASLASATAASEHAAATSRAALTATAKPEAQLAKAAPADRQTIAPLQSEFRTQLQKIQSLIIERKNMLDSVKSKGKGVAISLQPLVAKNGQSLDSLRSEVEHLTSLEEASAVRNGLQEVTGILNDDVETLRRLAK